MNYLELTQRLALEAGMGGSPSTVVALTLNEHKRAANWIADADVEIQLKYEDWRFMWQAVSFQTVAGDGEYTEADVTGSASIKIARIQEDAWRYYVTASGVGGEQPMNFYDWPTFRDTWLFGNSRTTSGDPSDFAYRPDRVLVMAPLPRTIFTITGEIYRAPVRMVADDDEPLYPVEFHMLPVWWALTKYAGFEEGSFAYTNAQNQLKLLWDGMERRERPRVSVTDFLA